MDHIHPRGFGDAYDGHLAVTADVTSFLKELAVSDADSYCLALRIRKIEPPVGDQRASIESALSLGAVVTPRARRPAILNVPGQVAKHTPPRALKEATSQHRIYLYDLCERPPR